MWSDLWKMMRGPSWKELERMDPFSRQLALAQQFNSWMAVGMLVALPVGCAFLLLAFLKVLSKGLL